MLGGILASARLPQSYCSPWATNPLPNISMFHHNLIWYMMLHQCWKSAVTSLGPDANTLGGRDNLSLQVLIGRTNSRTI